MAPGKLHPFFLRAVCARRGTDLGARRNQHVWLRLQYQAQAGQPGTTPAICYARATRSPVLT
eukprot:3604086-Rhodomonas_salina.4